METIKIKFLATYSSIFFKQGYIIDDTDKVKL